MSKAEELAKQIRVRLHLCTEGKTATQIANVEASIAILLEPHLVGEWRDIESEPHDDSDVLMIWEDSHVQIAQSHVKDGTMRVWFKHSPVGWLPLSILPAAPPKGEQSA